MAQHRRFAVALLAAALAGLTGCHSFQNLAGYSPSGANAAPGNSPTAGNGPFPTGLDANAAASKQKPLKNMQGTQSENVDTYLAAAQQMENSGKWAEAIAYYEIVRQLDPRKTLFCARHLAVLYDRKDDFDKSIDEYAVLLKANPKDSAAYNDFGYGLYCRGKFDAAEQKLRKAVEVDPKNALAWSNLGMALAQLNRYDESLSAFEKTAQKNGAPLTRAQALRNLAFIQASQRKWVEARDSYALALKEEPGMQKALTMLQRINEEILNGDRRGRDERKRARELERLAALDPEITRGIPFGVPTGAVGADGGMIASMSPLVGARTQPAVAPAPPPQSAVQLPPIPSTLEVD